MVTPVLELFLQEKSTPLMTHLTVNFQQENVVGVIDPLSRKEFPLGPTVEYTGGVKESFVRSQLLCLLNLLFMGS